jgi:hypothetical protein
MENRPFSTKRVGGVDGTLSWVSAASSCSLALFVGPWRLGVSVSVFALCLCPACLCLWCLFLSAPGPVVRGLRLPRLLARSGPLWSVCRLLSVLLSVRVLASVCVSVLVGFLFCERIQACFALTTMSPRSPRTSCNICFQIKKKSSGKIGVRAFVLVFFCLIGRVYRWGFGSIVQIQRSPSGEFCCERVLSFRDLWRFGRWLYRATEHNRTTTPTTTTSTTPAPKTTFPHMPAQTPTPPATPFIFASNIQTLGLSWCCVGALREQVPIEDLIPVFLALRCNLIRASFGC